MPSASDPNVLYYGPGVHEVGQITMQSGRTLYLAGGAIVRGWVVGNNLDNVTVRGRGYFDGSIYPRYKEDGASSNAKVPLNFSKCTNLLSTASAVWIRRGGQ